MKCGRMSAAAKNVPIGDERWEDVLIRENPDLFKWLNNQLPVPEDLSSNEVRIRVMSSSDFRECAH